MASYSGHGKVRNPYVLSLPEYKGLQAQMGNMRAEPDATWKFKSSSQISQLTICI